MITLSDLIALNKLICEDNREESVIINRNNLLSALSVQQWYYDPRMCAAALSRSIILGHGFQDGNKRTAAAVAMSLQDFDCDEDTMIDCMLSVAKGELKDVEEIASILYSFGEDQT